MTHDNGIFLNETDHATMYKCQCRNKYSLNYRNLFLSFSRTELKSFRKVLSRLSPENFSQFHPEGPKAVISHRKHKVGMGFTQNEVKELITLIEQFFIMEEAKIALVK